MPWRHGLVLQWHPHSEAPNELVALQPWPPLPQNAQHGGAGGARRRRGGALGGFFFGAQAVAVLRTGKSLGIFGVLEFREVEIL